MTSKDHGDWDELRGQEAGGVLLVESHTVNHLNLSQINTQTFELGTSKSTIDSQIPGKHTRYIAYPFGGYNSTTINVAQSFGYVAGVTTVPGLNTSSTPLFELRRNGVGNGVRFNDFKSIMGYSGSDSNGPVIVDNADSGFNSSSNWFPSSSVPGALGSGYHARATASASDAARWNVDLPESGNYEVFTRWTTGGNRATAAPYVINHNNGSSTVRVNQQQNNATWVSLGTYNFSAGASDKVLLSCWTSSGSFVIADAVRFVKQ